MPEYEKETTEQQRLEKEQLEDLGTVWRTRGPHAIHCLTVIGQIEGHVEAPQGQKTTKYEHVIPQLVAVQEDPAVEGLLVLINTVGGDVEAGLALAENTVLPSLLPLLMLFLMIQNTRAGVLLSRALTLPAKALRLPPQAAGALLFGQIGGYPTGAVLTGELLDRGVIDHRPAYAVL